MGCATGDFASYLLKRFSKLEVIGIDYHVELIEQAKKNYQKTAGCIAVKKKHLLRILFNIKKNEKIKIM
jgi:trans-aconitate methyltransferase